MTCRLPIAAVLTLSLLAPRAAAAEDAPPPAPSGATLTFKGLELKISGVIYADWQALLDTPAPTGTNSSNSFDLTRAYINVEPHVSKNIWLRITPDITRAKEDGSLGGNLVLRMKYAYAQFNEVLPDQAIKAGLQQTAYIDFEDSIWKYRVLGPSGFEFFTKVSSSDLGLSVLGAVLEKKLAYQVLVSNGEGYQKPEVLGDVHSGKYKDLGVRVTLAPFTGAAIGGLRLTLFGQYGITSDPIGPQPSLERVRGQGLLSYESDLLTLAAGGGVTRDDAADGTINRGVLLTAFGFVNLPLHLRVLARVDRFDPDTSTEGTKTKGTGTSTRTIGGLAYLVIPEVQVIADIQRLSFENETAVVDPTLGTSFFVHLEARY
jgi:hypothetical protein